MSLKAVSFSLVLLLVLSTGTSATPIDVASSSYPLGFNIRAETSATFSVASSPVASAISSGTSVSSASSSTESLGSSTPSISASSLSSASHTSVSSSPTIVSASSTVSTTVSQVSSVAPSAISSGDTVTTTIPSSSTFLVITPSSRVQRTTSTYSSSSSPPAQTSVKAVSAARETSDLSPGAIAGISVGVAAALIAFILALVCCHKKRQRGRRHSEAGQYLRGSDNAWSYSDVKSPAPPAGILGRSRSHSPSLSAHYTPVPNEMHEERPHKQLQIDVPVADASQSGPSAAGREERLARMKSYRTSSTASFYPSSDMMPTPTDEDPRSPFYSPQNTTEEAGFVSMHHDYEDDQSIAETASLYSTDSRRSNNSRRTSTGPRGPRATPFA